MAHLDYCTDPTCSRPAEQPCKRNTDEPCSCAYCHKED